MKAIFPSLTSVDSSLSKPEAEAAGSEQNGAARGFDAMLALVAAQTPTATPPVKALAPSVGVQPGVFEGAYAPRGAADDASVAGQSLPAQLTCASAIGVPAQGATTATTAPVRPAREGMERTESAQAFQRSLTQQAAPQKAPGAQLNETKLREPAVTLSPEGSARDDRKPRATSSGDALTPSVETSPSLTLPSAAALPPRDVKPEPSDDVVPSAPATSEQPLASLTVAAAAQPASARAHTALTPSHLLVAEQPPVVLVASAVVAPNAQAQPAALLPEPLGAPAEPIVASAPQPAVAVAPPVVDPRSAPAVALQPVIAAPETALAAEQPASAVQPLLTAPARDAQPSQAVVPEQAATPVLASPLAATSKSAGVQGEKKSPSSKVALPVDNVLPAGTTTAAAETLGGASARAAKAVPVDTSLPSEDERDARASDDAQVELTPQVSTLPIDPAQAGAVRTSEAQRAPALITAATPARAAAGKAPAIALVEPVHTAVDLETGARVTRIAYFASPPVSAPNAPMLPVQPLPNSQEGRVSAVLERSASEPAVLSSAVEGEGANALAPEPSESASAKDDAQLSPADSSGDAGTHPEEHESAPDSGAQADNSSFGQPSHGDKGRAFEPTDAHGIRGLDAVIASLLRAGSDNQPNGAASERVQSTQPLVQVQTAKSEKTKGAEKLASSAEASRLDALRREEESRALHEIPSIEQHSARVWMEPRQAEVALPGQTAAEPQPLSPAPVLQDADAAAMGRLARGEGVNGAAISIEHPDLGSIDVVVQNENGRVDVRAVLDTPRAAAVLRAHESALRYGVQQAGMTFGALRVRSRNGESEQIKSRDSVKRRRGQEWEA